MTRTPKSATATQRSTITPELIRQALQFIPPDVDRDTWVRVGMAIKSELGDAGFEAFNEWSALGETYDKSAARDTWRSIRSAGRTTIGTLFGIAKDRGFKVPAEGPAVQAPAAPAAEAQAEAQQRLAEQKRHQREAEEAEYRRRADQVARDAAALWASASDAGESAYLRRKGVGGYGVRYLADGTVLVPMRAADGELHNLQRIAPTKPAGGSPEKRFLPGGRKTGLFHVIGQFDGAELVLVAEGLATASSLHDATGRPVVVSFDAGNLVHVAKALRAMLPTVPLLICGDDDRATAARTGKNPGREKAASAARAAHSDAAPAGVVFPEGLPDGASDFNDLAAHAGPGAVRALVEAAAAAPTVPKAQRGTSSARTAVGAIDSEVPAGSPDEARTGPPKGRQRQGRTATDAGSADDGSGGGDEGRGHDDPFVLLADSSDVSALGDRRCDRPGVWFFPRDADGTARRPVWLCAPLFVAARTRTEDGNGWGMLLEFTDPDGRHKTWAMPSALLSGEGAEWAARLRDMGLRIAPGTSLRNRLAQYLDTRDPHERVTCTSRVGWHGGVYVQPSGCIGEEGGQRYVYQSEGGVDDTFCQAGTLDDWRRDVADRCAGNSRLVFVLCCAFGGPLMGLVGMQTGGFHLDGDSSLGKTTALLVAASVWGSSSFKQQWRVTSNALEATAAQHSDSLLILDEIGQADGRIVGECAYLLANEQEKGRSTRSILLRRKRTWRMLFLSSGEKSLAEYMHESGQKANEGQLLRMPSVPADAEAGLGMLEQLNGAASSKAFVDTITKACATHYGEAGLAWLKWLTQHRAEATERAAALMNRFEAECGPARAHAQVMRVAARFALLAAAGELATKAGLTGWELGEAVRGVRKCFDAWLAKRGHTGNGERYAQAMQVKSFLERNGDALFTPLHRLTDDHRPNTPLRVGFRRAVDESGEPVKLDEATDWIDKRSREDSRTMARAHWQYLCLPESFKREVCKGHDADRVAQLLRTRGHLQTEGDRLTDRQRIPGLGKVAVYLIKPSIFADGFDDL